MATPPALDGPRLAPRTGAAKQLIVLLHGYGADGNDLIGLGQAWVAALPHCAFASPHAPDFFPFGNGRQWYPLPTSYDRTAEDVMRALRDGVPTAAVAVDAFLDAELARLQLGNEALALVGFSQGATLALYAGLRRPVRAVLAYSGALGALPSPLLEPKPKVFLQHGAEDTVVPVAALNAAAESLRDGGIDVRTRIVPRMGHGIDPEGVALGAQFLAESFV
jgi:phospholipase/carboxylesterase